MGVKHTIIKLPFLGIEFDMGPLTILNGDEIVIKEFPDKYVAQIHYHPSTCPPNVDEWSKEVEVFKDVRRGDCC